MEQQSFTHDGTASGKFAALSMLSGKKSIKVKRCTSKSNSNRQ